MARGWGIFDLEGNEVFDVDSLVDLKYTANVKTSTFPVEHGSFASYNKVNEPNKPKVRLAVGGKDRIAAFQAAMGSELSQPNLYNVVTPTCVYLNVTMESYDYSQSADNGLNLLVVDIALIEVREVTPTYTAVTIPHPKSPGSASKQVNGKMQVCHPAGPPPPPPLTWANVMDRARND